MNNTNVITIEKNVPIPPSIRPFDYSKYQFIHNLEVGDSFVINGNTPDYKAHRVRQYVYSDKTYKRYKMRFSIRTLKGPSKKPTAIRVWRVA